MTYFSYRHIRFTRSEGVYVGSTFVGRVSVRTDWRSRLTIRDTILTQYRATGLEGNELSELYPSRHDAAEALYAAAPHEPGHG